MKAARILCAALLPFALCSCSAPQSRHSPFVRLDSPCIRASPANIEEDNTIIHYGGGRVMHLRYYPDGLPSFLALGEHPLGDGCVTVDHLLKFDGSVTYDFEGNVLFRCNAPQASSHSSADFDHWIKGASGRPQSMEGTGFLDCGDCYMNFMYYCDLRGNPTICAWSGDRNTRLSDKLILRGEFSEAENTGSVAFRILERKQYGDSITLQSTELSNGKLTFVFLLKAAHGERRAKCWLELMKDCAEA